MSLTYYHLEETFLTNTHQIIINMIGSPLITTTQQFKGKKKMSSMHLISSYTCSKNTVYSLKQKTRTCDIDETLRVRNTKQNKANVGNKTIGNDA